MCRDLLQEPVHDLPRRQHGCSGRAPPRSAGVVLRGALHGGAAASSRSPLSRRQCGDSAGTRPRAGPAAPPPPPDWTRGGRDVYLPAENESTLARASPGSPVPSAGRRRTCRHYLYGLSSVRPGTDVLGRSRGLRGTARPRAHPAPRRSACHGMRRCVPSGTRRGHRVSRLSLSKARGAGGRAASTAGCARRAALLIGQQGDGIRRRGRPGPPTQTQQGPRSP